MTRRFIIAAAVALAGTAVSAAAQETAHASTTSDATQDAASARGAGLRLDVGLGVGTHAATVPTAQGVQRMGDSPFAAAEASLTLRGWPEARVGLCFVASYRTSIAWQIEQQAQFALPERLDARAEQIELGAGPVLRLSRVRTAASLALTIGLGLRAFWPRPREFPVQGYLLGGPALRAEFVWPVLASLELRLVPELQWLALPFEGPRDLNRSTGLAFGAGLQLGVHVSAAMRVGLAYRESFARVPGASSALEDHTRHVTVRITGEL